MKKNLFFIFLFAVTLLTISEGCKKKKEEEPKSEEQVAIENISRVWKIKTVSSNVPDDKALYIDAIVLRLNTDLTYQLLNPLNAKNPPAKQAQGTWRFNNPARTEIIMDEGTSNSILLSNVIAPSSAGSTFGFSFEGVGNKNVKIVIDMTLASE